MPVSPNDFFPQTAKWPFIGKSAGVPVVLDMVSSTGPGGRKIELNAPPSRKFRAFFDRMMVTVTNLQLNRIRLQRYTIDIDPPLTITTDQHETNHVDSLLPGVTWTVGLLTPPYDGTVLEKKFIQIGPQGASGPDTLWSIKICSRSVPNGGVLMRPSFLLSRQHGLVSYVEELYGVWEFAFRTDLPQSPVAELSLRAL
jgi:hypothetical protein